MDINPRDKWANTSTPRAYGAASRDCHTDVNQSAHCHTSIVPNWRELVIRTIHVARLGPRYLTVPSPYHVFFTTVNVLSYLYSCNCAALPWLYNTYCNVPRVHFAQHIHVENVPTNQMPISTHTHPWEQLRPVYTYKKPPKWNIYYSTITHYLSLCVLQLQHPIKRFPVFELRANRCAEFSCRPSSAWQNYANICIIFETPKIDFRPQEISKCWFYTCLRVVSRVQVRPNMWLRALRVRRRNWVYWNCAYMRGLWWNSLTGALEQASDLQSSMDDSRFSRIIL